MNKIKQIFAACLIGVISFASAAPAPFPIPNAQITGGTIVGISPPIPLASGGTACASASGTCLDNITGFNSAGFIERTGAGTYAFVTDPIPVSHGGTGANSASSALTALGAAPSITGDLTLNVPAQYSTIQAACDFLSAQTIANNAFVTIKVADGTYSWQSIECRIPFGDQVQIIGNTTTRANVVINSNNANNASTFQFYRGHRIYLIDGFTINGTAGWLSHCNWNANTYGAAFLFNGSGSGAQIGGHVAINKMYYGILVDNGASVHQPSAGLQISESGDAGVLTRWGGSINTSIGATSSNACDTTNGQNLGFGFLAEVGGSGDFSNGTASGNNVAGFAAQNGAAAWAHSATASGNGFNFYANEHGSLEINNSTGSGGSIGAQVNSHSFMNLTGATLSGASGSGVNVDNNSVAYTGAGATANSNANGFTQYDNSYIFGTLNGTGNTFNLFVNGNTAQFSGGTFTGAVTMNANTAAVTLNDTSATGFPGIVFKNNGTQNWAVHAISSTNSFAIDRSVSGSFVDSPILISGTTGTVTLANGLILSSKTVSTLPTCNSGLKNAMYSVSDATSPTYNGSLTGGGSVSIPVYCNGSAWTAH